MSLLVDMAAYGEEVCVPDGDGEERGVWELIAYWPLKSLPAGGLP